MMIFEVDKKKPQHEWAREGKIEWRHQLRVQLDAGQAWEVALLILSRLRAGAEHIDVLLEGEARQSADIVECGTEFETEGE